MNKLKLTTITNPISATVCKNKSSNEKLYSCFEDSHKTEHAD
jgi:hypothetical protein